MHAILSDLSCLVLKISGFPTQGHVAAFDCSLGALVCDFILRLIGLEVEQVGVEVQAGASF